eukprot:6905704-Alexandrium_andersonii.AAC.1
MATAGRRSKDTSKVQPKAERIGAGPGTQPRPPRSRAALARDVEEMAAVSSANPSDSGSRQGA